MRKKNHWKTVMEHPHGFEVDGKLLTSEEFEKLVKLMPDCFWLIILPSTIPPTNPRG